MTRRKFIRQLIKAGSAVVLGFSWLGRSVSPRKFIHASRVKKYPGHLKPPENIFKQGKWSG